MQPSTPKLPLNCLFYTSTAGHFGHIDVYRTTIKHYKAKLGGSFAAFNKVFAHVKVKPSQTDRLPDMIDYLLSEDIHPIVTQGDWSRGLDHSRAYLSDMFKVYNTQDLHSAPYCFVVEDDSPINVKMAHLYAYLEAGIKVLEANKDILAVRFQRDGVSNPRWPVNDLLDRVDSYDFQPTISHIKNLFLAAKIINDNAQAFESVQCEAAFRMASDTLSHSPYRYLCFNPSLASSHHIGAEAYPEIMKTPEFKDLA